MKLEKVAETGGRTAGMRADLRQRTQSQDKFSWKNLPKAHIASRSLGLQ